MLFNSYIFVFLFLPCALLGYFLLNNVKKYELAKCFLIGMSLWFYAYFNVSYLWIILLSIGVNFACHRFIIVFKTRKNVLCKALFVENKLSNVFCFHCYRL